MERNDTSDITDDIIDRDLVNANLLYTNILALVYKHQSESTQRRSAGLVEFCCTPQQIAFLRGLVRLFLENAKTTDGKRIPPGYAAAAILYYYYQLVLIETGLGTFLDLRVLRMYRMSPGDIERLQRLTNFLVTSDQPYVVQIRRAFLDFNPEPFVGGKRRRRKNRSRYNR